MSNFLKALPESQPRLITQPQLDYLKLRFEQEVIDPIFFGSHGRDPKRVQAELDIAGAIFDEEVAERFEISNEL